jgi:hypothetical protein
MDSFLCLLVLLSTIGILGFLTGSKCHHILNSRNSTLSLASKGDTAMSILTASEGVVDCISLSSDEDNDLGISKHKLHSMEDFEQDIQYPLCLLQGLTTSFADSNSEKLNTQIHFNTDSVFFVCNNSTNGHVCNDIFKFIPGSIHQTNKCLTTAYGTGPCLQEGTFCLHLNDDDRVKHIFILDDCLYHPDSLANILSTRRLAEKNH